MNAIEKLAALAQEKKTILCFGIDPDIIKIQKCQAYTGKNSEDVIGPFFHDMITKLLEENSIAAIKPNYAYFAQYGFDGLYALEDLMQHYRGKIPIILDAKRGDIGKTAQAYAREIYEFWEADAVTVNPYLGTDSLGPFIREDKIAYVLCKTTNPDAAEFQELDCGGQKLYEAVAKRALDWKSGLVVGATSNSIKRIVKLTKNQVPLLIPGIGAQGGDLKTVLEAIKGNMAIHRISSSSGISYAFDKHGRTPLEAALKETEKLNAQMRKYF